MSMAAVGYLDLYSRSPTFGLSNVAWDLPLPSCQIFSPGKPTSLADLTAHFPFSRLPPYLCFFASTTTNLYQVCNILWEIRRVFIENRGITHIIQKHTYISYTTEIPTTHTTPIFTNHIYIYNLYADITRIPPHVALTMCYVPYMDTYRLTIYVPSTHIIHQCHEREILVSSSSSDFDQEWKCKCLGSFCTPSSRTEKW